jgi:TolB-like protein
MRIHHIFLILNRDIKMTHAPRSIARIFTMLVLFFSLSVATHVAAAATTAKEAKSVAVLPFVMHAPSSMDYLQEGLRDMLASRLAANGGAIIIDKDKVDSLLQKPVKPMPQQEAASLARQLGADYIVTGSLTSLGGSMSLDAKVIAADADAPPLSFFASAAQENEIIGAIDELSWNIAAKVFGASPPAAAIAPRASQPSAPAADDNLAAFKTEHPDKIYKTQGAGQSTSMASPIIMAQSVQAMQGFTKTQNLDYFLQGMDVGDVDGDGSNDIVMADERKIYAYNLVNNRLTEIGSVEMPARSKIHAISLGDMDGNGRAEIYISAADKTTPHSWAYEWDGSRLNVVLENIPWYIRTLDIPGEGRVLIGQRGGEDSLLLAGIFRLMKNGSTVLPQERFVMPDYVNLFDFALADLDGDGKREIVAINTADRLYVIRPNGAVLWVSDEFYGGTSRYIGEDYALIGRKGLDLNSTLPKDITTKESIGIRMYIPSRLVIVDVNNDGKDDVIVNKNLSYASRHVENYKRFQSSQIYAMMWNGIGLAEIWQTKKIDGYIPDFQFLPLPEQENRARLYVGLVLSTGWTSSFTGGESTMLLYDVELAGKKETEGDSKN